MVFETLPMNISGLSSLTPPNISISGSNIFGQIISDVNTLTNDYLIFASLFIICIILYLALTDSTPYQDFGYDYIRGLNISFASCSIIGLVLVEQGWSGNFYAVGVFVTLWFLSTIGVYVVENQE